MMSENLVAKVEQIVKSKPVAIFMKGTPDFPQCGFSARAVQALRAAGASDLAAVDVLSDDPLWGALEGDGLIRRMLVRRDPRHLLHHEEYLVAQYREMADPGIPIYPNPGFSCKLCPFTTPCLAHESDADEEWLLAESTISRATPTAWMSRLVWPDGTVGVPYTQGGSTW